MVRRNSLAWRLWIGYSAIVLGTGVAVWLLVSDGVAREAEAALDRQLDAQVGLLAAMAAPALGTPAESELQSLLRAHAAPLVRCTIVDAHGRVVADSHEDPARMGDHANRPEILAAHRTGAGRAERYSATLGTTMSYVARPVSRNGAIVGVVRTALSRAAIDARLARLRWRVAAGTAAALAIAWLLGAWAARRVAAPIAAMTATATAIAEGDYAARTAVTGPDELTALATALHRLGANAQDRLTAATTARQTVIAVLDAMVEGVLALDARDRIVQMNAAAGRLLGVPTAAVAERPVWEVVRVPVIGDLLARIRAGEDPVTADWENVTPGGRVVRLRGTAIRGPDSTRAGAVFVLQDVTEATRVDRLRREFVANASHELKTPITAARGLLETVLDDAEIPAPTQRDFLERGRVQLERLSALVRDLLTLSRLESPAAPTERTACDLGRVVRTAAESVRPLAEGRAQVLDVALAPDLPTILGDAEALRDAVTNLCENASKYTPSGGTVRVRCDIARPGWVEVTVADTGPGIPTEHLPRVFERFYRVDKARSRELGGTGLGLAIVKHVALAHGGEVACESPPGAGATFRLRLPVAGDSPRL